MAALGCITLRCVGVRSMRLQSSHLRKLLGAIAASVILSVIGALSIWIQQPLLVPSLASAVLVQTLTPEDKSGQIWPTFVGQLAGLAGGLIGVCMTGAHTAPIFIGMHPLFANRLSAGFVAILVTGCLQLLASAISPAGGATALIVALGMETPDWSGIIRLTAGIVLVTGLGEVARHLLLRLR
jgi:hypothetical protein